jgi:hypothetical protein
LMTKPAATEMLRFRTTGGAENGEGGDLEKPLLAVLRFNPCMAPPGGRRKFRSTPMKNCARIKNCQKLLFGSFDSSAMTTQMMVMATPGAKRKFEINPMKNYATRPGYLKQQPRCGAKTRAGVPCQRPPIRGRKRCRLHGGLSPGAPRGVKNGNFKSGDWTAEAIAERKWLRSLVQSFAKNGITE